MGTLRRVEREVLRRRYGNKKLCEAYRASRNLHSKNYVVCKRTLTHKGEKILKGIIALIIIMIIVIVIAMRG